LECSRNVLEKNPGNGRIEQYGHENEESRECVVDVFAFYTTSTAIFA
jgi:hypothetical protein